MTILKNGIVNKIPSTDSINNVTSNDVIGNKSDTCDGNSFK